MPPVNRSVTVNEIFLSLQGEGTRAGRCCAFVRLAGCNLRCTWCDTRYAWDDGETMTVSQVLDRVAALGCKLVEVTGGEPLVQQATPELLRRLCDAECETLLETNGSLDISNVDTRVARIVDFKCPSSGQDKANRWANAACLTRRDEVKFVIADRADFDFAAAAVSTHSLVAKCPVIFQPVADALAPATLAEWILASGLDVRLGVQLHKIVWPGRNRGV